MPTLGDLRAHRQQALFVGRDWEAATLDRGAGGGVFYVHGPGGVGKTALVRDFVDRTGLPAVWIDAHDLEATPDGVMRALGGVLDARDACVIVFDSYELARGLDRWVREALLPRVPTGVVVIFATRDAPGEAWRTDPLWGTTIRPIALANLATTDAHEYLARRGVDSTQRTGAVEFTRGQPLALTLVADVCLQRAGEPFTPDDHPDVVYALVERFAREVPGARHRTALEACAVVRSCNESLLGAMLDEPDVRELFAWLRGLSFVQHGHFGVFPHDLARDALVRELKWRDPDGLARFIARAHAYYEACIADRRRASWRHTADDVYLHRFSPMLAAVLEWNEGSGLSVQAATSDDVPALVAMVTRHEGAGSAALVAHWLARQLGGAITLRDADDVPAGFVLTVSMLRASRADIDHDPATRAVAAFMTRCTIRRGDDVVVFRAWMARDSHQTPSPAQNLALLSILHRQLTTPNLAMTFLVCHDADAFAEVMRYSLARRIEDVDFEVGGHRFGAYYYDFRHMSPSAFLAVMAKRAAGGIPDDSADEPIDHDAFVVAVRDALVEFGGAGPAPDGALARSRLVRGEVSRTGCDARFAIERLVREVAQVLGKTPRGARHLRVLEQTYLGGRIPQEHAAEALGLPFSTYRRYLSAGTSAIAELLWIRELATM